MGRNSNIINFVATSIEVFNAADVTSEMDDHFISKKAALLTHPIIQSRCINYYKRVFIKSSSLVHFDSLFQVVLTEL